MSDELDIDGLHTDLEADPNNQVALNALIEFYQTEGAIEELMELYLSQLEIQTEERLPLYQGLAEVMHTHLDDAQNARVVVLEGLQEFKDSANLLERLAALSNSDGDIDEYLTLLKAVSLQSTNPLLHALLNEHLNAVSPQEFEQYVQTLKETALEHGDAEPLIALLDHVEDREDPERDMYISQLAALALELRDMELLKGLVPFFNYVSAEVFDLVLEALKVQAIDAQNASTLAELLQAKEQMDTERFQSVLGVVNEVAVTLSDDDLLIQLMPSANDLNEVDFTHYMTALENLSEATQSLSLFEQLIEFTSTWGEARMSDLQARFDELTVKVSSPLEVLIALPHLDTISDTRKIDYADAAKQLLTETADQSIVNALIAAAHEIGNDVLAEMLIEIFKEKNDSEPVKTTIQSWFLTHAKLDALDAFMELYASTSEDFDAISNLMRARAERGLALGENESSRRSWQQRALSLNPSETGLHEYFETPRHLDAQDLNFLSGFVSEDQTDARIGLRAMLRALEFERDPENSKAWLETLAFAYRRSPTFDADHQTAIELFVQNDAREMAAQLLIESANQEPNPKIQRSLYLDAGDHLLTPDPKAAARCYYKAFETKNDDRVILSKLLDAYQKSEEWTKSIKVLKKLASLESDRSLRAKYLYAMGVIQRDKREDHLSAVRTFDKALDADPTMVKAIQAIDEVITDDQDFERQDRYYRKCLARAIEHNSDDRVIFQLAQNLATLNISKLNNEDAAIKALTVARAHAQNVAEIDKQLLGLYRANGALEEALALHYHELSENPLKARLYRELFITLRAFGLNASAACVDRTLVALGQEPQVPVETSRSSRSGKIRHFGQHTWQMLRPLGFDILLDEVFALLSDNIRQTYALADDAYRFSRPEPLGPSTIPAVFTEVVSRLRVPLPAVWFSTESAPVSLVHRTVPALVLGSSIDRLTIAEQRFIAARILMLTKPEYFLASHPSPLEERVEHLTNLFNGCIQLTKTGKLDKKLNPLVKSVLSNLESKDILSLTQILGNTSPRSSDDIRQWLQHIDLMAGRVGFLLTDNLEIAIRLTRELTESISDVAVDHQLTDLLLFSVSQDYLMTCGDLAERIRS